jgi:hypothetical protein
MTDEMVAGHRIDDRAVSDLLSRVVLVIAHNADFDRRFLERAFPPSPRNIGRAAVRILIGRQKASVHLRSNSLPTASASFTTGIGPQAIVGPPSMRWRNRSPVPGGSHCRLSWSRRDCRHGGYGRGTPPLRRRMFSRHVVTPGAPESSGDRNPGTAMCRTPIKRQRCPGSEQM